MSGSSVRGHATLGQAAAEYATPDVDFEEPHWNAPLDGDLVLRRIPPSATIAGMFLGPTAHAVQLRSGRLPSARDRYVPFHFYPLSEHVQLLLEACDTLFPSDPLRIALRRLGRAAPSALINSMLGRVTLGAADGVNQVLEAMVKTYPINLRPCVAQVLDSSPRRFVIRFEQVCFFLDSHHVGVLEGAMRHARVKGRVRIRSHGPHAADMLCTW